MTAEHPVPERHYLFVCVHKEAEVFLLSKHGVSYPGTFPLCEPEAKPGSSLSRVGRSIRIVSTTINKTNNNQSSTKNKNSQNKKSMNPSCTLCPHRRSHEGPEGRPYGSSERLPFWHACA